MNGQTLRGVGRIVDPKYALASASALFLAVCAAAAAGPVSWGWLAVTLVGLFAIDAAKNASGEIYDFDSGDDLAVAPEDRSPFSGGKRVLVDGLLSRGETWTVAGTGYLLGIAAGLSIVLLREPRVLWIGMAGVGLAFFYHANPIKLSYRGLGEFAVGIAYGPILIAGAYLVQRGNLPWRVLALSVPYCLAQVGSIWVQEFPDFYADRASGKRNMVVRLGRARASKVYAGLVVCLALSLLLLPAFGLPWTVLLGLAGVIPAVAAARRLLAEHEITARMIDAQRWAILCFTMVGLGTGLGMLIGGVTGDIATATIP